MLRLIADHQISARFMFALAALLLAAFCAVAVLGREEHSGRHDRGVHRGTAAEIRRHRRRGRSLTWTGTISVRPDRTATTHVLDLTSPGSVRHRAALRYEETGEISLDALMGPRRQRIGASA